MKARKRNGRKRSVAKQSNTETLNRHDIAGQQSANNLVPGESNSGKQVRATLQDADRYVDFAIFHGVTGHLFAGKIPLGVANLVEMEVESDYEGELHVEFIGEKTRNILFVQLVRVTENQWHNVAESWEIHIERQNGCLELHLRSTEAFNVDIEDIEESVSVNDEYGDFDGVVDLALYHHVDDMLSDEKRLKLLPLRKMWSKKFLPHLSKIRDIEEAAISTIRYDYDSSIHTPNDAGRHFDSSRPKTRTCAAAFQMFGYCHLIAIVMLCLARIALPNKEWLLVSSRLHSFVISMDGDILDIISIEWSPIEAVDFVRDCCNQGFNLFDDPWKALRYYQENPMEAPVSMDVTKDIEQRRRNAQGFEARFAQAKREHEANSELAARHSLWTDV